MLVIIINLLCDGAYYLLLLSAEEFAYLELCSKLVIFSFWLRT